MRVLMVEDEPDLLQATRNFLAEFGLTVDAAADGEEGLFKALGADYDAIILDLMLPRLDGGEVLCRLRAAKKNSPVLLLTARDSLADKIQGLNLGADDYLTKPFDLHELLARLRALIRRASNHPAPVVEVGDIEIDTAARVVRRRGSEVPLAVKEYAILELLMFNRGKLVTRRMIYEHVYGDEDETLSNVVDVYICNLRRKLGSQLILTRRGEGYMIRG
jgi:two-component system OmpR family response regulator